MLQFKFAFLPPYTVSACTAAVDFFVSPVSFGPLHKSLSLFRHPPPPWILDGLLTYWSHWRVDICIAHTQNGSTCCAFLQWKWHKIINRSLFFDSWHVILLANASQLHFYRSFSGGRLCFFFSFPPRCQHSATGVVSREGGMGEGLWHKAGGPLPAYLLLPAASSKLTAKSSARTHPQRDRTWIPCHEWLVNGCKYTIDVPPIDLFPDPSSHHGQWQVSKRVKLFLWEPLTHRGRAGGWRDREDEWDVEKEGNT